MGPHEGVFTPHKGGHARPQQSVKILLGNPTKGVDPKVPLADCRGRVRGQQQENWRAICKRFDQRVDRRIRVPKHQHGWQLAVCFLDTENSQKSVAFERIRVEPVAGFQEVRFAQQTPRRWIESGKKEDFVEPIGPIG
jgi:hypothetical protein